MEAAPRESPGSTPRTLSWRPRTLTLLVLLANVAFALYAFSPIYTDHRGVDSRVFYAAGVMAAAGGSPYDAPGFFAEQDRLFNQPHGYRVGDPGYDYQHTYANPPLFTALLREARVVGWPAFFWVVAAASLAMGLLAFELILRVLAWEERRLPRLLFLFSSPMIIQAFFGNTSAILLLAWAAGLWLMSRRRELIGGSVLAFCWLKPTVGLLVVAALLIAGPGGRRRAAAGFAAGSLLALVIDVALTGPAELQSWLHTLFAYGSALTGQAGAYADNINGLAGSTAFLLAWLPRVPAIALAALAAGALFAWLHLSPRSRDALGDDPQLGLAVAMSVALAFSPYLHFNDLVLAAFPLLVLASRPLDAVTRGTLVAWGLLLPGRLVILAVLALVLGDARYEPSWWNWLTAFGGPAGLGSWLTSALLLAVAVTGLRRRTVGAEAPARWGPLAPGRRSTPRAQ